MTEGTSGIPIPDIKHLEQKDLIEKLTVLARDKQDERVKYEKMLATLEQRAKSDLDRLRSATASHTQDLDAQIKALLKAVSRLQQDVERLEKENISLKMGASSFHAPASQQTAAPVPPQLTMVPSQIVPVPPLDSKRPIGGAGTPPVSQTGQAVS